MKITHQLKYIIGLIYNISEGVGSPLAVEVLVLNCIITQNSKCKLAEPFFQQNYSSTYIVDQAE